MRLNSLDSSFDTSVPGVGKPSNTPSGPTSSDKAEIPGLDSDPGRQPANPEHKRISIADRKVDSIAADLKPKPEALAGMHRSPLTSPHLDENGNFTPERQALHDAIISRYLDGVPSVEEPVQYMNGGGPASGKGTMTTGDNAKITGYPTTHRTDEGGRFVPHEDPQGVIIDPDQLKLSLPEAQEAVRKRAAGEELSEAEQQWAANLHNESSHLSKRLQQAALDRGVNMILDGVNNGSTDEVLAKVDKARESGYSVEANYIYLDPQEALKRAESRGKRSGRFVPKEVVLGAYAELPQIFDDVKLNVFDKIRLFDNNGEGNATLIAEGGGDKFDFTAPNYESVYQRYLDSAKQARSLLDDEPLSGAEEALQDNLKDLAQAG